ncbi:MAG TPA: hypothetical protein VNO30_43620 [Kofleriaceae bacterium]|nr:hypothetical protein [Kofleriaceae bacterium]
MSTAATKLRIWLTRIGLGLAGIAVALVIAEVGFWYRDGGAFPHVNFYKADAALGTRLEPHAEQRISFGGNPVTSLRTNGAGYRGAEWPASTEDEIIVVGDSQVFGLGVEENQTFSARLAEELHRPVINAGVPTYGPAEYRAVIEELLAQRKAKTVVLTLNLVNDTFELGRPNTGRHAVWDGWAVRKENAPEHVTEFPARRWLFGRSHLVFALRRWLHDGDPTAGGGVASEGNWRDLITAGKSITDAHDKRRAQQQAEITERREAAVVLKAADDTLEAALLELVPYEEVLESRPVVLAGRASPGDIVSVDYAEESRATFVTAELIRQGVAKRKKLRADLAAAIAAKSKEKPKNADALAAALDKRTKAMETLLTLAPHQLETILEPPLAGYVRDVATLCKSKGARLVVAILPIDVQVSPTEWAKYNQAPTDMTATHAFTEEIVAAARAFGLTAFDATGALAAAEPGAFLNRDIHMTAKGHAAVGKGLAAAIAAPPPQLAAPARARSLVPVPQVWPEVPEVIVTGSTAAGCETKMVREWLRVMCGRTQTGLTPTRVTVAVDATGESQVLATPKQTSLVTPLEPGRHVEIEFAWTDHTRLLTIDWPLEAKTPVMKFAAPVRIPGAKRPEPLEADVLAYSEQEKPSFASPVERAICDCWNRVYGGLRLPKTKTRTEEIFVCSGAYGAADAACTQTYATDCARMVECIRRDPASPPNPPKP